MKRQEILDKIEEIQLSNHNKFIGSNEADLHTREDIADFILSINDKLPRPIGLHGCYCHPFESWEECERMHKQTFRIGEWVANRHTKRTGTIYSICSEKGYYIVKQGDLKSDQVLEHAAMLIKIEREINWHQSLKKAAEGLNEIIQNSKKS